MAGSVRVLLKKAFSLSLVLNSLITLAAIAGIMYGFYHSWPYWKPYSPYLINANLLLVAGVAAIINIFPGACIGRALHTGRLWFHHYVYGFFVLLTSSVYVVAFTSVSLVTLFLVNSASVDVNAGRFFVLTGLTLLLDDLPDVSKRIEATLNKIKSKIYQIRKGIHALQLITGFFSSYAFLVVALSSIHSLHLTFSNALTMTTLLITSITSFACVKRGAWLKITPAN